MGEAREVVRGKMVEKMIQPVGLPPEVSWIFDFFLRVRVGWGVEVKVGEGMGKRGKEVGDGLRDKANECGV